MANRSKSHRVISAVLGSQWAILPEKLEQIAELLELRASGVRLSRAEVQASLGFDEPGNRRSWDEPETINGVRVIEVFGTLAPRMNLMMRYSGGTSTQLIQKQIRQALNDKQVKSILLRIDSPGGQATGTQELADMIHGVRGEKPIVAFVQGMAASAAYWVASAADEIVAATEGETVGSVGVYLIHGEASKAYEQAGVKYSVIRAGSNKAAGNPYEPLSKEARAVLQEGVDETYALFVGDVARNRGVSVQTVLSDYGQGRVFSARQALAVGMIDRITPAATLLAEMAGDAPPPRSSSSSNVRQASAQSQAAGIHQSQDLAAQLQSNLKNQESPLVNPRIKAALYALELIDDVAAEDAVCSVALKSFFKARGQAVPADDKAILDGLTAAQQSTADLQPTGVADNVRRAQAQERAEADAEAAKRERKRLADIADRGKLLGVSAEAISAAQASGDAIGDILERWTSDLEASNHALTRIEVGANELDKFTADATDALCERVGIRSAEAKPLNERAKLLVDAPLMYFAKQSLTAAGRRLPEFGAEEDIAKDFLKLGDEWTVPSASASSFNRAGDFPNLLSNLAGKMLDSAIETAEVTYPMWTAKLPDIKDFKPKAILAVGKFDELDMIQDDEEPKQLKFDEEMPGWIQIDRFANKVGITPVMMVDDDLDAFTQGLASLMEAHEYTLNRLCLSLLTGNVTMLDGEELFSTAHANVVTSGNGGVPSVTQMSKLRKLHRQQPGIAGKGKMRISMRYVLLPSNLETDAEQVLLPAENFRPITDATVNPFRNRVIPIVEPELDDSSTSLWYSIADPARRRTIAHAFQTGYGRGGRRTSWYEQGKETRYVKLEGRFAAAVAGYRGICRNFGD